MMNYVIGATYNVAPGRALVMYVVPLLAALGASFSWACGAMIATTPAKRLGAFELTRIQLVSSAFILALIALWTGAWPSVEWHYWPRFAVSSLVGVVVSNVAMAACLRRGGARRTQLLETASAPIAAILGWLILGEAITSHMLLGIAVVLAGITIAIFYGSGQDFKADQLDSSLVTVVFLGLLSAATQAVGLIAIKPVLLARMDPLAASALRTGGAAIAIVIVALWPAKVFEPASERTAGIVMWAIVPGVLGYVIAVSLLLYALGHGNTGVVAILGSTSPVMMLPMMLLSTRRPPPLLAWAGAVLVVCGMAFILQKTF